MDVLSRQSVSLLAAAIGMLCLVAWPLFKTRRGMLLSQLGIASGFALHYALGGLATASLLNILGAIQVLIGLLAGTRRGLHWIGWAMLPAIGIVGFSTWAGLPSVLSGIGMILVAIGRIQSDPRALRILILAGTPFWLVHDAIVGSPLVAADLFSLVVGIWALWRQRLAQSHRLNPEEKSLRTNG